MSKYILKGDTFVPYIKRYKKDRVYWEDVLPHERITESDLKRIPDSALDNHWEQWHIWNGCGRAILLEWVDEWGNPDYKYKVCHIQPVKEAGFEREFCSRHIRHAYIDFKINRYDLSADIIKKYKIPLRDPILKKGSVRNE
jgi:hypothetical protein|tara:strand:+ start:444 stop:866 length:423 start_codon:yes stop_codon:yes gene_type:complete